MHGVKGLIGNPPIGIGMKKLVVPNRTKGKKALQNDAMCVFDFTLSFFYKYMTNKTHPGQISGIKYLTSILNAR